MCTATAAASFSRPITPIAIASTASPGRSYRTTILDRSPETLRGLHLQLRHPQGKLIRVIEGEIFDVAVDVRRGSPTFGRWVGVHLNAERFQQVYVPPGFAHGFAVVSPIAQVAVQVHRRLRPRQRDRHRLERPGPRISWPIDAPLLSARDRQHPTLGDVMSQLPQTDL